MDSLNSQIGRLPGTCSCLLTGRKFLLPTSTSNLTGHPTEVEWPELPLLNLKCMGLTCTQGSSSTQVQTRVTRSMLVISSQVSTTSYSCKPSNRSTQVSMKPKSFVIQLPEFPKAMDLLSLVSKRSLNALFKKCKEKPF